MAVCATGHTCRSPCTPQTPQPSARTGGHCLDTGNAMSMRDLSRSHDESMTRTEHTLAYTTDLPRPGLANRVKQQSRNMALGES